MNDTTPASRTVYLATAIILLTALGTSLALNKYLSAKLGYTMIAVGFAMFVISLLLGSLGVLLSLRARSRAEPIGLWLFSTALAFVPAVVYIGLVARQFI